MNASDMIKDLPDGSEFLDGRVLERIGPLVRQVASISLPVGVKELAGMVDDLEKKHGKGLVMRQIRNALIISQPNAVVSLNNEEKTHE